MKMRMICACAGVALGLVGMVPNVCAETVTMLPPGDSLASSTTVSWNAVGCWDDGQAPHASADYLVALGGDESGIANQFVGLRTPGNTSSSTTFGGRSLTLGVVDGLGGLVLHRAYKKAAVTYNDLRLVKGCYSAQFSSGGTAILAGNWSVFSPVSDPFSFVGGKDLRTFRIQANISGEAGTSLQVRSATHVSVGNTTVFYEGDNSRFAGSFKVQGERNRVKFVGDTSLGSNTERALIMADNGILVCDDTSKAYDKSKKIWIEPTGGCVEVVADTKSSLAVTLTGEGTAQKVGAGTLAFSGSVEGIPLEVTDGELVWSGEAELVSGASLCVSGSSILTGSAESLGDLPVVLKSGGVIRSSSSTDHVTLNAAAFEAGGCVMAWIGPAWGQSSVITLGDGCKVSWPLGLAIEQELPAEGDLYAIVRIPAKLKTVTKDDFQLVGIAAAGEPAVGINIQEDAMGYQVVSVYRKAPPVTLVVDKDTSGNTFANGAVWSDGQPAHAGVDYVVEADTIARDVRSSDDVAEAVIFPGESLTLMGNGAAGFMARLLCMTTSLTVDDLRLNENAALYFNKNYSDYEYAVVGKITIAGSETYPSYFYSARDTMVKLQARLVGGSEAKLTIRPGSTNNGVRHYDFLADNSAYLGAIEVSQAGGGTPSLSKYMELRISDEKNLGGNPASFNYHALTLTSYGCLAAKESLTIDDANRGIFVDGAGQVSVDADCALTVISDLGIYGGTLFKRGTGMLKLGCTMRYGKTGTATGPGTAASKAILEVREGALQPLKGAVCEKLQLKFAADGCLRVAPQDPLADAGLKEKGVILSKFDGERSGTIAPVEAGEMIHIDLAYNDMKSGSFSVPILTVPAAVAETLRGNIRLTHTPAARHTVTLTERTVGDDVQFCAYYRDGFMVYIR